MQTASQPNPDEWRSIADPREKKRAQNRVAQRSYRKRVKQRLEDLQAQVQEQDQARAASAGGSEPAARGDPASGFPSDAPFTTATSSAAATGAWLAAAMATSGDNNNASRPLDPLFWGGHDVVMEAGLSSTGTATGSTTDASGAPLSIEDLGDGTFGYAPSSGEADSSPVQPLPTPTSLGSSTATPGRFPSRRGGGNGGARSRGGSVAAVPSGRPSSATSSSVAAETTDADADAPLERRLEHLVASARALGFANFDALATAYYTAPLDPHSPLRVEQRLSRNRWLPALLAQLRECAAQWSAWERRGYEAELLRGAEEICRAEWSEALLGEDGLLGDGELANHQHHHHSPLTQVMLQDRLPNLWALLTGLTASNTLVPPQHRAHAVFASILLLAGLNGPSSMMWIG